MNYWMYMNAEKTLIIHDFTHFTNELLIQELNQYNIISLLKVRTMVSSQDLLLPMMNILIYIHM